MEEHNLGVFPSRLEDTIKIRIIFRFRIATTLLIPKAILQIQVSNTWLLDSLSVVRTKFFASIRSFLQTENSISKATCFVSLSATNGQRDYNLKLPLKSSRQ